MSEKNPLHGTWYSSVGSKLVLEIKSTALEGKFESTQDPGAPVPVFGAVASIQPNPSFLPVSFSASWPAGNGYGPSVTSYTGQYTKVDGHEQIEIIFLLANQVESTVLWKSVSIASEIFTRKAP
ncbi:MAG: hypothetical protein JWM27_2014 [Gemmatimonadetes bacterium]|nr:hypothetical protein [Gemmatimonadota bacterium]